MDINDYQNKLINDALKYAPKKTNEQYREEEQVYWNDTLDLLKSIKENTANLSSIVDLIIKSNTNQDKIIEIIKEFLDIATIKEDPKAARSLYRKVMDKIHTVTEDANTIIKLTSFGILIGEILKNSGIM